MFAGLTFQKHVQLDVSYSCKAKQNIVLILLFFFSTLAGVAPRLLHKSLCNDKMPRGTGFV